MLINEFFSYGRDSLVPYIETILNAVFKTGIFPENWSVGLLVPLYKKVSIRIPDNYRGITLLSALGKLFNRTLNNRLNEWAEKCGVYTEAQGEFRARHGTVDNIFILHSTISATINSMKTLYTAFIKFSQAFDYGIRDSL